MSVDGVLRPRGRLYVPHIRKWKITKDTLILQYYPVIVRG